MLEIMYSVYVLLINGTASNSSDWQVGEIKLGLYSHQTLRLLWLLISSAPWICKAKHLYYCLLCTRALAAWCLKLLCFNFRKHCCHVSNLSDRKISVLTPEDYCRCSISTSLSAVIYLPSLFPSSTKTHTTRDLEVYKGSACKPLHVPSRGAR